LPDSRVSSKAFGFFSNSSFDDELLIFSFIINKTAY
jgi:hypothetical protein